MIRAIETEWKGYRYRSRLDARWAVFFDAMGQSYEYEPEGYTFDGQMYLPDFRLDSGVMVEIKPRSAIDPDSPDGIRIRILASLLFASGTRLITVCGEPHPGEYSIYDPTFDDEYLVFAECRGCHGLAMVQANEGGWTDEPHLCTKDSDHWPVADSWSKRITAALRAARQARFEHGELPRLQESAPFALQCPAKPFSAPSCGIGAFLGGFVSLRGYKRVLKGRRT